MHKSKIRDLLAGAGVADVVTPRDLADKLGIGLRTVYLAKENGELHLADRNTIHIEEIVEWLSRRPRYLTKLCTQRSA